MLGHLMLHLGEFEEASAQIEAAVPELRDRPDLAAKAMVYLGMPLVRHRTAAQHVRWLERADALLPAVGSEVQRLWLNTYHATALLILGEQAGWGAAERIPEAGSTQTEQQYIARGLLNVGQYAAVWGRFPEAARWITRGTEMVEEVNFLRVADTADIARAHLDWYTGSWDRLADRVSRLAESEQAQPASRLEARLIRGLLCLARGDRREAEQQLRSVEAGLARRGQLDPLIFPAPALARLRLADGAAAEALALTGPLVDVIAAKGTWLWATDVLPVHVDALIAVGRTEAAEALLEPFEAWLSGRSAPAPEAALTTCRALVAEARGDSGAAAAFVAAARAWAALPRPYDELLAAEREGRCMLAVAGGRTDAGLAVLSEVQRRLSALGARWDADRVAQLLRRHGVDVARAGRRGRLGYGDQLSPRELEVTRLAARGLTNRQVAEALFLSPKTVAHHLSAAMHKLNVGSRTALVMAAADAGMLTDQRPQAGNR